MANPDEPPVSAEDAAQQDQNDRTEAHLRKALSTWNADQQHRAEDLADTRLTPKVAVPKPVRRASRARPAPVAAPEAKKQPFGMSYDGSSITDYVQSLLAKGSR